MTLRAPAIQHLHRSNRLTTAPASEPVTAAQLRTFLYATVTELPDDEANLLIAEAREYIETHAGLALITQSWRMTLDHWPGQREDWWDGVREGAMSTLYSPDYACRIALPRAPLASVTNVKVYDEDGTATVYAAIPQVVLGGPAEIELSTVFNVDSYSMPGRLSLRQGAAWPVALRNTNGIEINYVAGYGDDVADVPASLKRAVRMLAAKMFAERGDGCSVDDAYVSSGAKALVDNFRNVRI
jgi:uncharacterized phiE125 gp8 family phage protein